MPSAAVSAILEGMPEAADLWVLRSDGQTWIFAGTTALFRSPTATPRCRTSWWLRCGRSGSRHAGRGGAWADDDLRGHAAPAGAAGRDRRAGPAAGPAPHGDRAGGEQARAWRAAGVRDAEIARRPRVQQSMVLRRRGLARVQGELEPQDAAAAPGPAAAASREDQPRQPGPEAGRGTPSRSRADGARAAARAGGGAAGVRGDGAGGGGQRGVLRACGGDADARLSWAGRGDLAASGRRWGAGRGAAVDGEHVLRAGGGDGRAGQAPGPGRGRAAGRLAALPSLRTLRPRLAAVADAADPLAREAASRLRCWLRAWRLRVDDVDDHFVLNAGANRSRKGGTISGAGREGPRGHARDHGRRAGGVVRDRRALGTVGHAAQGVAELKKPSGGDGDHAGFYCVGAYLAVSRMPGKNVRPG